ncbi:MAG: UDP-N-acetylmuramoyl-L-alanine--D-glutamate ligase [bacterium]
MKPITKLENVIIHGFGVEGKAAIKWFLQESTATIFLIETDETIQHYAETFDQEQRITPLAEQAFPPAQDTLARCDLYLRSPGIAPSNSVFESIRKQHIPHTTPTGYWLAQKAPGSTITITGTKGKSSTASLTSFLLQQAGQKAVTIGNIGVPPFAENYDPETILIVELSSYMMHDVPPLPFFHVVTSLYHEHTPWHGSHEAYAQDKLRPFFNTPPSPGLIPSQIAETYSLQGDTISIVEDYLPITSDIIRIEQQLIHAKRLNPAFANPALLLSLRNAIAILLKNDLISANALPPLLEDALPLWHGLPSRQFCLPTDDNILWVDDALATIPEATLAALARWQGRRIHLLLGGLDRGQDFAALLAYIANTPEIYPYHFSQTSPRLNDTARKACLEERLQHFTDFAEMIEAARLAALPQDIILFSPAAPTAPPHKNYQERAQIFQQIATGI